MVIGGEIDCRTSAASSSVMRVVTLWSSHLKLSLCSKVGRLPQRIIQVFFLKHSLSAGQKFGHGGASIVTPVYAHPRTGCCRTFEAHLSVLARAP